MRLRAKPPAPNAGRPEGSFVAHDDHRDVRPFVVLDARARAEGEQYGPMLLAYPASAWRQLMRANSHYRSFGTLRYLLGAARDKFLSEPSLAREIVAAVLSFLDEVEAPTPIHKVALRGLAWKEYANAMRYTGDLREALAAAERAVAIYGESPSLHFFQTAARLVASNIYRDLGDAETALRIARECAGIFRDYADSAYRTMARMSEGGALFSQRRYTEALDVFTSLAEEAELENDHYSLAQALLNGAECARELGDLIAARDLYPRALKHFEELGMLTEAARVRWASALLLAAEGKVPNAVSELFLVRGTYLRLGANISAAAVSLDVVRIRFDAGQDVRDSCGELVTTFAEAGMTQNAIEALAYLREQAKLGTITSSKIEQVKTYFGELSRKPSLQFARLPEEEG
jgi:tetratricopeptide (TPR) repeat protein